MCGIVGGWLRQPDTLALEQSVDLLHHRGPDGRGTYFDRGSGVVLGHTRLAIIDLSESGRQPMSDGDATLTYNGEIYNYRELKSDIEAGGMGFSGSSDTEVLLRLYKKLGLEALPKLNGIFAFALHDKRKNELVLARDALGVKPLYYSEGEHGFAFASEIKALLPLVKGPRRLDLASLSRYATFLWCPGEGTPLTDVRKLDPGEAIVVRDGHIVRRWKWYELPVHRGARKDAGREESIKAVRDILRRAVARQMVADVPVGAFLSGGLDSSAVVAFAREHAPDIRCFTIGVSGGEDAGVTGDLPYAQRVAKHLGVPLEVVRVDAARMADDLEDMVYQLDEPLSDPAPLNVLYISRLAREHGVKVLLSGAGGDDLLTGYRRHYTLRYETFRELLPSRVNRLLGSASSALDKRTAFGRRMGRLFMNAADTKDARLATYLAWVGREDLAALYSAEMATAVRDIRADQPMLDYLADMPRDASRLDRMLALDQRFFLIDHNLIYTDKMAMAASVEVRVPFLDVDFVELAARIPDAYKQHGRIGKWVLKKAMEPYLPHEVIYRPKTGFGAPLRRWTRHELRELIGDLLSEESLRRRGLFSPPAVQRLIADNDSGRRDAAYTLFSLLSIEVWCRRFLDQGRKVDPAPTKPRRAQSLGVEI